MVHCQSTGACSNEFKLLRLDPWNFRVKSVIAAAHVQPQYSSDREVLTCGVFYEILLHFILLC